MCCRRGRGRASSNLKTTQAFEQAVGLDKACGLEDACGLGERDIGVLDDDIAVQTAPRGPSALDGRLPRLYDSDKVVHDSVRNRFVENSFVAEPLQIHLQTLQLDAVLVGHIGKDDGSVIRLACFRANRSKLGAMVLDRKVSFRAWIVKDFQKLAKMI